MVESEFIYDEKSSRYGVQEMTIAQTSDFEEAVKMVDEMNRMNALKTYYVELLEDDNSTHQIYGYNLNIINNRQFKSKIQCVREC